MYTENKPSVAVQISSNQTFRIFKIFDPPINNRREHRLHTTSRGNAKDEFLVRLPCPNRPKRLIARVRKSVTLDTSLYLTTDSRMCLRVCLFKFVSLNDIVTIQFRSNSFL